MSEYFLRAEIVICKDLWQAGWQKQHSTGLFFIFYMYIRIFMCICISVFVYVFLYAYNIYLYVYMYMYFYMCICTYMQMKKWGKTEFWGLGSEYDPDWILTEPQKKLRDDIKELCRTKIRPNAVSQRSFCFVRECLH